MTSKRNAGDIYRDIGVTPVIHAGGSSTASGGSKLRPEAMEAMSEAATIMVRIQELNEAAGKVIAGITGAEAGFVSSGAAGGLVLQAAACIAGSDPAKMAQLPDASGLKNEIVIHRMHRFSYDHCYRAAGARFVEIGDGRQCAAWELEAAFTERTAAVAYLFSPYLSRRAIPFREVCEMAHARGVPVIVDAASYLPPRANLRRFTAEGADMVIYSGGKGVRGPQGTGILCGRADLIEAAAANASPNPFIGRGMKVAKEEIVGLIAALRVFVDEDEEAETKRYREMSQSVVDALIEVPGLVLSVEHDEYDSLIPIASMKFTRAWRGPGPQEVLKAIGSGDPPIVLKSLGNPDTLSVDPFNLTEGELEVVIRRLHEVLLG
jgi:D-glucosaminate-6-phosphate ammonia-lyase